MPYRNRTTGEIISDEDFQSRIGSQTNNRVLPVTKLEEPSIQTSFGKRLISGFGTPEEKEQVIEPKGLSLTDLPGDIADVAGAVPSLGGFLGGAALGATIGSAVGPAGTIAGGIIGAALGSGAGEFLKQRIGSLLGVQKGITTGKQLQRVGGEAIAGATAQALGGFIGKAAKPVSKFLTKQFKNVPAIGADILSTTTGRPAKAVQEIAKQPEVARLGFELDATIITKEVRSAAKQVKSANKKAFGEGLDLINKQYTKLSITGKRTINDLLKSDLKQAYTELVEVGKKFGIQYNIKGNIKNFPVRIESGARKKIKEAHNLFKKQKDFSPKGFDGLVKDMQSLQKWTEGITTKNTPVVLTAVGKIRNIIKNRYPEFGALRTKFATTEKLLGEVNEVFRVIKEGPVAIKSGVSRLTNIFVEDQDIYIETLKNLEKASGINFLGRLAGTEFSKISPGILRTALAVGGIGTGAFLTNPVALLLIPLFSPRAVGGGITRGVQALEAGQQIGRQLAPVAESAMRGLLQRQLAPE